jgi:hypothetical protein
VRTREAVIEVLRGMRRADDRHFGVMEAELANVRREAALLQREAAALDAHIVLVRREAGRRSRRRLLLSPAPTTTAATPGRGYTGARLDISTGGDRGEDEDAPRYLETHL